MRNRVRVMLVLAVLAALGLSTLAFASDPVGELVRRVRDFTKAELSKPGATAKDPVFGEEVFVGASATRVAEVHDQAAREYDTLRARSPEERETALKAIREFAAGTREFAREFAGNSGFAGSPESAIEYGVTVPDPNGSGRMVEMYWVGDVEYWIDPQSDTVIRMLVTGPGPVVTMMQGDTTADVIEYSVQESEAQARGFLKTYSVCFENMIDTLEFQVGEKRVEGGPSVRFFRWEIPSRQEGMPPYIQVGVTSNGVIVNYSDFICISAESLRQ